LEQAETSQLTDKYGQLQRHLETERAAWVNDKKILEDTIFDLTTSGKHSDSDRTAWEAEIRQLEERAKVWRRRLHLLHHK
jgi:nucleoprotein TPR